MVLVTGGTGLVGSHLLLQLVRNGIRPRAIHRRESNLERVRKVFSYYTDEEDAYFRQIEWVEADINDLPALTSAFRDIEEVYHTAALISFDPADYKRLKKVNQEGTANVVNLCISNEVRKLCYASTIGAIGKSVNGLVATEENEWLDREANVYALTKHAAEMEVWRASQEGVPVAILNPGVIIGPGFWDRGTGELFRMAWKAYRYYPPGGTGFVTVHDVVALLIQLMHSPVENERFIVVARNLSYGEILKKLTTALGKSHPKRQLRPWQLRAGQVFDWLRHVLTGHGRRITATAIRSMLNPEVYSNDKVTRDLDFRFGALEDAIRFSCEKFLEENA